MIRQLLNGALTAAISGGALSATQLVLDPGHFDFQRTGSVFLAGAVIGVLNWLRQNPWHRQAPDPELKKSASAS